MRLAVLSGKGGTGKTTVAASLAKAWPGMVYVDCDVEEPNGYIFLKPDIDLHWSVDCLIPEVDSKLCTLCGACADVCQFNALACTKEKVLVFSELCHHCGACRLACPQGAVHEIPKQIGVVEKDTKAGFIQGRLTVGEPIGIPIIDELKAKTKSENDVVYDCPPGASCSVVHSLEEVEYGLIVAEPTPFGLHDMKIAVALLRKLKVPFSVVINKKNQYVNVIRDYCALEEIHILVEIPFSTKIAKEYSQGNLPLDWGKKIANKLKNHLGQPFGGDKK